MLEGDVIEPSIYNWAAEIVFVPEKDVSLRFCIGYRRLKAVTIRESYPIPRLDEYIHSLGDGQVFSNLDYNSGLRILAVRSRTRGPSQDGFRIIPRTLSVRAHALRA